MREALNRAKTHANAALARLVQPEWLLTGALSLASVFPIVLSSSVPAFQQDWSWPISRDFAGDWVSSFLGQWSAKGLGQPNLLPLQTYMSFVQYALIVLLGPSLALAAYLMTVEVTAVAGILAMLRELELDARRRQVIVGWLYAFGPIMFTRVQAGHLAFLLAYALLPWLFALTRRTLKGNRYAVIGLGIAFALAASQVQFLLYGALVVAVAVFYERPWQHWPRIAFALTLALALQLQGIIPLMTSAARDVLLEERPIVAWEQNLSAPMASAAIMLGYFTQYYEKHASVWSSIAAWIVLMGSAALTAFWRLRVFAFGVALVGVGVVLSSGLNGPLGGILQWLLTNVEAAGAFRDLQYAGALTALGTALLVGGALDVAPRAVLPLALGAALVIAPALHGFGLGPLLLPREYVDDTRTVAGLIAAHGAGRILWLPSEEPVGLSGGNTGLDIAIYGSNQNPSANQERDQRELAFAVSSLRAGRPRLDVFRRLSIRYLVTRDYIQSARGATLGTGLNLAFPGVPDAKLAVVLARTAGLLDIGRTKHSSIFEISGSLPISRESWAQPGVLLQSQVAAGHTAILPAGTQVLSLPASRETADPRNGWVSDFVGRWFAPWISDSIYPFVWTVSRKPLYVQSSNGNCLLLGTEWVSARKRITARWRERTVSAGQLVVKPKGTTAAAFLSRCTDHLLISKQTRLFVFASRYDQGWRRWNGASLRKPQLADGWAMAWAGEEINARLVYLPALEQGAAAIFGLSMILIALAWARRRQ